MMDIWNDFNLHWGREYANSKYIITYLGSYPNTLNQIHLTNLVDSDQMDINQREWIWLCSQLSHAIDKDFFKPFWVPLQKNSLNYFIDISLECYPIFEIEYIFFKPYKWYKKYLIENISDLLTAEDLCLDLAKVLETNEKKYLDQIDYFFKERKKLGF